MKTLIALMLACAVANANAGEQHGSELSNASGLVAAGSVLVVSGSLSALAASGGAVVASVQVVGESTVVVLEGASAAASATVQLSGQAARGASLVVGNAITVSAITTGYLLISAGKVIAFLPNEAGKALLHHSQFSNRARP